MPGTRGGRTWSCDGNNSLTFQGQEVWIQAKRTTLWTGFTLFTNSEDRRQMITTWYMLLAWWAEDLCWQCTGYACQYISRALALQNEEYMHAKTNENQSQSRREVLNTNKLQIYTRFIATLNCAKLLGKLFIYSWEQWHKEGATVSGSLVENGNRLGNWNCLSRIIEVSQVLSSTIEVQEAP